MADLGGGRFAANRWAGVVKPPAPTPVAANATSIVAASPPAAAVAPGVAVSAVTDPFAAPQAPAALPAAVADPGAALAAIVGGLPVAAVPVAPVISDLPMDGFFQADDFIAGHANTMGITHNGITVVRLHFDGADFTIKSPDGSGITYDVTKGFSTTNDITVSQNLQDGDIIFIKITGQAEQFRWVWRTPAIVPASAALPPAPAPAVAAPVAASVPASGPAAFALAPLTADEVHDQLTPQDGGAVDSTAVVSPSDICFRVETLREISDGVWAAMIANGSQGSIEGLSGVGHTRKGKDDEVNRTGIGYAVVRSQKPSISPVEVSIAADGTSSKASGIVIEEILAQLTRVDSASVVGTSVDHIADLVKKGIEEAHPRIQALPPIEGLPQGTTVQVSIVQDDSVVNLWIGDTVGFVVHAATGLFGLYNPAHSLSPMPFTTPQLLKADGSAVEYGEAKDGIVDDIANELIWLKAARAADTKPILLGQGAADAQPTVGTRKNVVLKDGGWYGMATSDLLGKGFGFGNIRNAILGDTTDEGVHWATFRIMENWVNAVDSGKDFQMLGSQMRGREVHTILEPQPITDGSIALWLSRVASPKKRVAEEKLARAILRKLRNLKPKEFAVSDDQLRDAYSESLLGAAALARWGRYPNPEIIRRVLLGISATTP